MHRMRRWLKPYLGTWDFYQSALMMLIPIAVQQLINNLFNMVDNLMVGRLDVEGLAMSAVSVANKPYTMFFGVFFGMAGAAGLMISQYYGAKDRKTCQGLFSLQMLLGFGASLFFFCMLKQFPRAIMTIFVHDERTIELGVEYLSVICYSYLPVAISNTCVFSLRALGKNKTPMVVSMGIIALNTLCNYALIFGKLGFPALGVVGAAYGTLAARMVEMAVYLYLLLGKRVYFTIDLSALAGLSPKAISTFFKKAVPLISNELLWSMGLNVFFWCYARLDEACLPAITIAEQCNLVAAVLSAGVSSAVSVMIGMELGANRLAQAKENCKKLFTLDVAISLASASICCMLALVVPQLFSLSASLKQTATAITLIMAVLCPFQFIYGFCFFCLRAGGDTRSAMLLDSGYLWLVPVPAAILMGVFLPGKISLALAVPIVQFLMYAKAVLALIALRRGKWIKNITQEELAA